MNQQEIDSINQLLNPNFYGTRQTLQEKKNSVEDVIAIITRAIETGQGDLKTQARAEAQTLSGQMKENVNALLDACKFPAVEEDEDKDAGNEKEEGGKAKPEF
jgi:hypothetical protein